MNVACRRRSEGCLGRGWWIVDYLIDYVHRRLDLNLEANCCTNNSQGNLEMSVVNNV